MSRSKQKIIAFGKSKAGNCNRSKNTRTDYLNKRLRKKNLKLIKQHHRYKLQTLEDFKNYVRNNCNINEICNDMYDRRNYKLWLDFLDNKQISEELITQFALILFNKYRSK